MSKSSDLLSTPAVASGGAAVAVARSVPPYSDLSPKERLESVLANLPRLLKSNVLPFYKPKPRSKTSGGMHYKQPKAVGHKNPNSQYDRPLYSRPFFAGKKDYSGSNFIDIMFGNVMEYLLPGSTAKTRVGEAKGQSFFFSKEIPDFLSYEEMQKRGKDFRGKHSHQVMVRFLATAMFLGDADPNRKNFGIELSPSGNKTFRRIDLELAGNYNACVSLIVRDRFEVFIETKNYFRMLLLRSIEYSGGMCLEAQVIVSADFALAVGNLEKVNLEHVREILTESFKALIDFIGPEIIKKYSVSDKLKAEKWMLEQLNDELFGLNPIASIDLTISSWVDRVITEMRLRLRQLKIWSDLINFSLHEGVDRTNIKDRIDSASVEGDGELVAELKLLFIDLYKKAKGVREGLIISDGVGGVVYLLKKIA